MEHANYATLYKKFLSYCVDKNKPDNVENIRSLEPALKLLAAGPRQGIFSFGFISAIQTGNTPVIDEMLKNDFFGMCHPTQINPIYLSFYHALESQNYDTFEYLLEHPTLDLKTKANTEPYATHNMELFTQLCGRLQTPSPEPIEYMANYLEANMTGVDLLSYNNYFCFKAAWMTGNEIALGVLVKRFNITGEEPEIKRYLELTIDNPSSEVIAKITKSMKINSEKKMLENKIAVIDNNFNANSYKHKI